MEIHDKQDQDDAAEGKCAGEGGPETPPDRALLDLSNAAVKELIRSAEKRGYVTHDQINGLLSSEEVKSEQIEDILAKFSEMGVNVVETKETELEEEVATGEEPDEEAAGENELIEVQQRPVSVKSAAKEPAERTDDPVRMYLREMGSKELLSREGEIAIAKRIEAGREATDRGALRESAHLPGHYHLAGRAQRGQGLPSRHHRPRRYLCRS